MAYIDLVLCKHIGSEKLFLFRAPAWSGLDQGQRVIVETRNGEIEAIVEQSVLVNGESEVVNFIITAAGATLPLKKVISKIKYEDIKYKEEETENAEQ